MSIASRRAALAVLAGTVLLTLSFASRSWSAGSAPEPPKKVEEPAFPATQGKAPSGEEKTSAARATAEKLYAEGYGEVEKGKKELDSGKEKDAKKRFEKALKKFEGALERDPAYYQAWNMVGFCARHTGDLKRAFAAYEKCLSIQPDYDEAHEYLGEAYIQSGDLTKAKVELAWLRANDSDEADELAEKIAKAEGKSAPTGETKEAPTSPAEEKPSAPSPSSESKRVEKAESGEPAPATGSPAGESSPGAGETSTTK